MTTGPLPKALLFDLDGTLYRQAPLRALMALELLTLPFSGPGRAGRRLRALSAYRAAQERLRHQPVADPAREQLEAAATASGLPLEEVNALVADWMLQRPLKYLRFCRARGLESLLALAGGRDMRLGLFSDYPAQAKLRALGLEGRFSPVLCASDEDIRAFKPHPRGYLRACEIWGLAPSEVWFVGDRPDVDAAGALAAGMRCVIVGQPETERGPAHYEIVSSFEGLSRVIDRR